MRWAEWWRDDASSSIARALVVTGWLHLSAFWARFLVLVGDRQAESLDQEVEVTASTEVGIVKLTMPVADPRGG